MGANTTYQQNPILGQGEVYERYQAAMMTLACRVLAEPYNFHLIDELLVGEMLDNGYAGKVLAEAKKQFYENRQYSPQSIGLATGFKAADLLNNSTRDSNIDLPAAWLMFEAHYEQWVEAQIAGAVMAWIGNGSGTNEIKVNADKVRREKGIGARVVSTDGKEEFGKQLVAAIDCKPMVYPVRPPLQCLREKIPYYEPGEYVVVGARTGMGKSYFGLNCNFQVAMDGHPSAYINLENTPANVQRRIWQMKTGIEFQRQYPNASPRQVAEMLEGLEWVKSKNNPIKTMTTGRSLSAVLNAIRRGYYEHGIQLAVVDYIQKITEDSYRGNKIGQLSEISAELRQLATDLKIPIIALAQISREAEKLANKRPSIEMLKGCGDIEQDASIIHLLYRPGAYEIELDEEGNVYPEGYADIFTGKGRDVGRSLAMCRYDHIRGFYDAGQYEPKQYNPAVGVIPNREINDEDVPF